MKKFLAILLTLLLALSLGASFAEEAAEENAGYTFDILSKVYDYHDSAIAVVIPLDCEVESESMTTRTFSVYAKNTDMQHEDNLVYFEGYRTITDIYANSTGEVGDKAESGNYIVIELLHGANIDEAIVCPYFADTYAQSAMLTLEYTVTQHANIGDVLPAGTAYTQGALRTETVDEFAYGGNDAISYRLYSPELVEGETYPLVIWLHGFGERGTDNETTLRSNRGAVAFAEEEVQSKYPSFVMAAQASSSRAWTGEGMIDSLLETIKGVIAENPAIDTDRVYISGVSSGGYGTWAALVAEPDLFAAAMPLAPAYTVVGDDGFITDEYKEKLDQLTDKPIYIIHGDGDPVVNINKTSDPTYQYLTEVVGNPNVLYTKIKDVSYAGRDHYTLHNVEVRVFNHDVVFDTSWSADNPSGDLSIPYEKNDSTLTPFDWLYAQSK